MGCPGHSGCHAGETGNVQRQGREPHSSSASASHSSGSLVACPWIYLAGWRGSWRPSRPHSHPAATRSSCGPQLWPRWLPRGPCPTQRPSCGSREPGLSHISHPGPKAREFAIETEKKKKTQEEKPGFSYPQGQEGRWHLTLSHRWAELPHAPLGCAGAPVPLRSLASPALRDAKGKGEQPGGSGAWRQLPSAWAGMSGPHRVDCRSGSTMVSRSGDSM